jgi:hypothetical protein
MDSQGKKHTHGKIQEKMVWSIEGLPNNIVLVFINNFEPNSILVNVNELKPYKCVDQTLKGIQSSKNKKSLEFINSDHMEKKYNEE